MEDNYEEFAFLNEEMNDPFSNKIPLWPMNQKKTVAAMEKVFSEANSKNINNFKQIPVSFGRGIEKKNLRYSRQSDATKRNTKRKYHKNTMKK